jgi:hypothetical protein
VLTAIVCIAQLDEVVGLQEVERGDHTEEHSEAAGSCEEKEYLVCANTAERTCHKITSFTHITRLWKRFMKQARKA